MPSASLPRPRGRYAAHFERVGQTPLHSRTIPRPLTAQRTGAWCASQACFVRSRSPELRIFPLPRDSAFLRQRAAPSRRPRWRCPARDECSRQIATRLSPACRRVAIPFLAPWRLPTPPLPPVRKDRHPGMRPSVPPSARGEIGAERRRCAPIEKRSRKASRPVPRLRAIAWLVRKRRAGPQLPAKNVPITVRDGAAALFEQSRAHARIVCSGRERDSPRPRAHRP